MKSYPSFQPPDYEEYLKVQTDRQPAYLKDGNMGEVPISPWHADLFNEFKPYLASPHLDIGCRDGLILDKLEETGIIAYGVELTEAAKAGQSRGRKIVQCDAQERLPFEDKFFKSASITHALEHFFKPVEAMKELIRVLDGYLLVIVPSGTQEMEQKMLNYAEYMPFPNVDYLADFLESCGFEIIHKYGAEIKGPHCLTVIAKTND